MSKPKLLVLLSDLHVGSTAGILQPGFVTHEGYEVGLTPIQKWLWACWQDCWKWARTVLSDEWACVVAGDLLDGNHHSTLEIFSPDANDHSAAAVELLKPVLEEASSVYILEGTHVHTHNREHSIASVLASQGVKVKRPGGRLAAWPELRLSIAGTYCEIDHHMPTTMRSYLESSAFAITLGDIRNQRARAGDRVPKVIVRAHRHRFGLYEDGFGMMISTPSWEAGNRFTRRVIPGMVPQVGLVILDWRKTEGDCPPVVHKRLHTLKSSAPQSV